MQQAGVERREQTRDHVLQLLEERQHMLVSYCELAGLDPFDEVSVAALTAARKNAKLDSALRLLLKGAAPGLEHLDERRAGRC